MKQRPFFLACAVITLTGCAMGPNYKRPAIAIPEQYRGSSAPQDAVASVAETKWADLFDDETLRQLVDTSLKQNFDLRMAAERVEQARAQLTMQRANLFPFFNWQTNWNATRASTLGSFPFIAEGTKLQYAYTQAGASASWELDVWGRLRRLNESARAQYLATEENRLAIRMSLVAEVMNTYFALLEQDLELQIARRTVDVAENGLRLTKLRRERGAASGLDVHQAEQLLFTATAQIAAVERGIEQTENALSLLLGQPPGQIPRGKALEALPRPGDLPTGMPAELLTRRPDIRQAEQVLISANAQIGAARALFLPQISLTAFLGGQSRAIRDLFSDPARFGTISPTSILPIFRAGQLKANVRLTEAQQREALLAYQKAIYGGLRDVADALVAHEQTREQVSQQEQLVNALNRSTELSRLRYQGGLDSFLQVLDSERNLFQGQLVLSQLRMLELQSVVRLYRALGGGWN